MARVSTSCVLALGLLIALPIGCTPPPPDNDALLWYFRNVPIHGEVRRVWPAGQQYVDDVLTIHAELAAEIAALEEATRVTAVWPVGDPRWDDQLEADAHHRALVELSKGKARPREMLLADLREAVANLPEGLELSSPDARPAFVQQVLRGLAPPFQPFEELIPQLETLVAERAALVGVRLADNADDDRFASLHAALMDKLRQRRTSWIRFAEERLAQINQRLDELDKRKQRDEYSTLFWERKYLTDEMRAYPKRVYTLLNNARKEHDKLESREFSDADKQADQQKRLAYLADRIANLEAEHKQLKARVDEILSVYEEGS